MKSLLTTSVCFLLGLVAGEAAVISWNGSGDGTNFNNDANWVGNIMPGPLDEALISGGAGTAVVVTASSTVLSVQSSKPFAVANGIFAVTSGASQITGAFTLGSGTVLSAAGAGTTFTANGSAVADDANFSVVSGAVITLPTLAHYTKNCSGANWTAMGAGSVINLPGLTNILGGTCTYPVIQAIAGGKILLTNVVAMAGGPLGFQSDGSGSVIDLSNLSSCVGQNGYDITFEAAGGGNIQLPQLRGGPLVSVTLNPGGVIPTSQMTQLFRLSLYMAANCNALTNLTQLTVDGVTNSFLSLSNFFDGSVVVENGAHATFPVLQTFSKHCNGAYWTINGTNSVLNFPVLTNIIGDACSYPTIQAILGGQLFATNLVSIVAGPLAFQADGPGSLIDLSKLSNCSGQDPYYVSFEASAGGTVRIPNMTGGLFVGVLLNAGGNIPTAQITRLTLLTLDGITNNFGALTNLQNLVSSVSITFPALVDFTDGNVTVNNGATVTMPVLRNYAKNCAGAYWTVSGSNSVLNLPLLTNITGQACQYPTIQAASGGSILLTNVSTILAGPLAFAADGTNSLIDLSALSAASGRDGYQLTFEASAGGTIRMPNMTGGPLIGITINPGANLPTSQIRRLYALTLAGQGGNFGSLTNLSVLTTDVSMDFPALFDFNDGNIVVTGGATVTLPAIQNFIKNCLGANWSVSGSNSVLILAGLTNITGAACSFPVISAQNGGQMILSNLLSIAAGPLAFQSDGSNSFININRLANCSGQGAYTVNFEASAGGVIGASNFFGGPLVGMIVNPGGTLPLAQMRQLFSITANNGVVAGFPALTNLDGGELSAQNGGQIILPVLQVVNPFPGCNYVTWQAYGSGSMIIAPALSAFVGTGCAFDFLQAVAGGQLVLSNLTSLNGPLIQVLATGAGSVVDLSRMSSFISATASAASLTAENGGIILLGTQAFLLQNIAINIPPGNPLLPPLTNSGPNLTLYGKAGHSYLIEKLITDIPGAAWQFFARVPLTNALQQVSAASPPDVVFRITDFVADPPIVDLARGSAPNLVAVLFGATNKTYELDSTLSLTPPITWTSNSVAVMTNAFRIFPPFAAGAPSKFYRAKQIAP